MERSKKRSLAQTPAPTKDKIYGSKVNKKGSASSESNAESIKLSDAIVSVLEGKMEEHNAEYPNRKVTLAILKAVFRRGAGAYSRSHRPTISGGKPNSRTAWAYARVNKFLEKKAGKPVKKAYVQDDDLIGKYEKGGKILYHGSPYSFDEFKLSQIGTGEGYQAFGWGLYFTDLEDIARNYAIILAKQQFNGINTMSDEDIQKLQNPNILQQEFDEIKKRNIDRIDSILNSIPELQNIGVIKKGDKNPIIGDFGKQLYDLDLNALKSAKSVSDIISSRNLYKVSLHKDKTPDEFTWLEWDKKPTQKIIRRVLKEFDKMGIEYSTRSQIRFPDFRFTQILVKREDGITMAIDLINGSTLYWGISSVFMSIDKEASLFLLRTGIDGIKYPAESFLRRTTSDTARGFNYVVFDDDFVKIEDKQQFAKGGEVDLNFYDTTPEHAKKYGFDSKSPMFVQNVCLSNKREIKNLEKHAKSNNHDLIFGHIAEKSEPNVKVIKDMLEKAGFTTIEGNNDFYKYVDTDNFHLGGDMSKHLAPNGKRSNLNHEQWHLVRTPEFKAWFGDWENDPENASKVVDENGEPLLVYHATNYEFNTFDWDRIDYSSNDKGFYGKGFYFGESTEQVSQYGKIIKPYFLKIVNPVITNDSPREFSESIWGIGSKNYLEQGLQYYERENWDFYLDKNYSKKVTEYILSKGRDGLYAESMGEYVVYQPEQIKLADGSNTTFDGSNPDIRFAKGGEIKDLIVLHNINSYQIEEANKLGGLVTPSIAIVKAGNSFTDFGSITLIGTKELIDPENRSVKVFAGDVYSPSVPRKLYYVDKKLLDKVTTALINKAYTYGKEIGDSSSEIFSLVQRTITDYSDFGKDLNKMTFDDLIRQYYDKLKLVYIVDKSIKIKVPMKDKRQFLWNNFEFTLTPEQKKRFAPILRKYTEERNEKGSLGISKEIKDKVYDLLLEVKDDYKLSIKDKYKDRENSEAIYKLYTDGIDESFEKYVGKRDDWSASAEHNLSRAVYGEKVLDEDRLKQNIKKVFSKQLSQDYEKWLSDFITQFRGSAYFLKGNQKMPYTLNDLVDATSSRIVGQETNMTFGVNQAKSYGTKRFNSIADIKKNSGKLITKEEMNVIDDANKDNFFNLSEMLNYKGGTWDKLDSLGRALADYFKGSSASNALSRNDFKSPSSSSITLFEDFANELKNSPVDYFEAKYQRAVSLSEFKYAIVPKDTSKTVIEILNKNGLIVRKYANNEQRLELINQISSKDKSIKFAKGGYFHLGGDMSKHLAPNGKPSNLNHEQWHLVRTPEFKAWFGDWENDPENASKVVDENGEPLVVYHGTDTKFNSFNKDFIGSNFKLDKIGFFFTSSYDSANMSRTSYPQKSKYRWTEEDKINAKSGFVISSFLNIRNPLRLNEVDNVIYNSGVSAINTFDHNRELIIESIVRLRKDGFILKKESEYLLIATEPAQIKLADGSNTTFDGSNPDIRYAKGGYLNKDELVSKALLFSPSYWLRRVPFLKAFDVYGNYEAMQSLYFKLFEKPYDVNYYIQDKLFTFKLSPRYILEVEDMENGNIAITLLPKFTIKDFDMPNDRLEEEIEHYEIQFINGFRKTEAELSLTFEVNPTKRDMDEIINKINKHFFWFIEFSEEIGFDVTFEKGGLIDPEKAKQILEDGKIRGKKLTDKQRRFFWASAVRKMAQGTLLETRIEDSPLRGKSLKDVSDLREIYQLAEKYKVGSGEIRKEFFKGIEVESEHTKDYGLSAQIALNHLNEDKDYYSKLETLKLEKGGKLEAENNNREIIHNSGNAGGVLVGRRHSEGGIKAINRSTGQPLEMEGGEVVITRNAVSDNEKKEFEGEMLTNREILSRINVSGGGVSFEEGGEVDECGCSGHKYNYGGEVLEDYEIVKRMAKGGVSKSVLGNPAFYRTGIQFNWEEFVAEANQYFQDEKRRDYSKMNSFILKYENKKVFNYTQTFTEEWLEDYIISLSLNTNYKLNKGVIERFVDREIFNNILQKESFGSGLVTSLAFHVPNKIKKILKQDIVYHELEFLNDLKDFTSKDQLRENLRAISTEKGIGRFGNFSFVASDAFKLIHFPNVDVTDDLYSLIEDSNHTVFSLIKDEKGKIESLDQLRRVKSKINWRDVIDREKYVSSTAMNALFIYDLLDRMVFLNDVFSPITKVPIFRYDIDLGLDESYSTSFDPEFLRDIVYFLTKYSPTEKNNYPIKFRLKDRSTAMCYVNYAQNDFTEITPAIMSKIIENDYFGIAMPIQSLVSTKEVPFLKIPHTQFFKETLPERTPETEDEVKYNEPTQQEIKDAIDALKLVIQFSENSSEIEEAGNAIDALSLLLD